ncbi:sugar ABC transporter ATP-binding protein [Opitutaceae bacterium TAV5]|nr:sugar ABC transporter ATP-binding protein [Opitutaceae bacterium TAV5]
MAIIEARGILKRFPGVVALRGLNLAIQPATVHCIIGENGAGKSTFVKILTGVYTPDEGEVIIDGNDALHHPHLFEKIAYVPQELSLFPHMTVAENLFMPFSRSGIDGCLITGSRLNKAALPWLEKFHLDVRPSAFVRNLTVSEQQLLQIARALTNRHAEALILDEPTTSLTDREAERLFRIVRQLKSEGRSIIFISHKLDEIYAIGDDITVLRNGEQVGHAPASAMSQRQLISLMSGKDIDLDEIFRPARPPGDVVLEVKGLGGPRFRDISFTLREGEILGFAGLVGAGRSEIMQTLYGYLPQSGGEVHINGDDRPWKFRNPTQALRRGLLYLPEERKLHGILPHLSVRQNIGISVLRETAPRGFISLRKEAEVSREVIGTYEVKTAGDDKKIVFLSGGNQQKVIIGRAMRTVPKVLIFDEPTKGIDVKAKADIYRIMRRLAEEQRVGIILVSSEMKELLKCSSRIVTIYHGSKTGEFDTATATGEQILGAIIGVKEPAHTS